MKRNTYMVLGGYGQMGKVTSRDLVESTKNSLIIIAGRHGTEAKRYVSELSKLKICRKNGNAVKGVGIDASDISKLTKILKGTDVCLNCAQYTFNIPIMKACLKVKVHYLDLGGLFHTTKKQLKLFSQFKKNNLTAVLGCGSTPGITNVLAGYGSSIFEKIHEIHIRFADHDETNYGKHFVLPYSIETLFDEFSDRPALFTKGKLIFVKPMSGRAKETFPKPFGTQSTFYTLHSELATFPNSFKQKGLRECSFKVSFPEDFVHDILLLKELGFDSKEGRQAVKKFMKPAPHNIKIKDREIIRVIMKGIKKKKNITLTLDCIAKSNPKWNFAAGDIDTGTPISIMAQMILNGRIKKYGVFPPELCVPYLDFFRELKKRGMKVKTKFSY